MHLREQPETTRAYVPVKLLSSVEHRLRHVPVKPDPRETKRSIRLGKLPAESSSSIPVPEDVPELIVTYAEQPAS